MKENLKLTGRALQTLLLKAVNIVDTNPAKVALGLVKAIIEISKTVKDNKDAVARQIASTGGQLEEVVKALDGWKPSNQEETSWMNHFNATLKEELQKLKELGDESNFRKFLDHEDEQARIKEIFVSINEARISFLNPGVSSLSQQALFLDRLKPSDIAHHDYLMESEEEQPLRRQVCTPGTRVHILDDIITWANETSSDCPNVYWLFGHAGSGKTTIAYTIARRFEYAGDSDNTIILGGNFFCSRQFTETRLSKYIIRTIVYHLALNCKPFADALQNGSWKPGIITQSLQTQLDGLLFQPWQESEAARLKDTSTPRHYLVVIDALDEIDGTGGSEFLSALLKFINQKHLLGLKFFVTSRLNPGLVADVEKFEQKHLYRLQDVEEVEVRADIKMYLNASLINFATNDVERLVMLTAGLFIYAATVVKVLKNSGQTEQGEFLEELFTSSVTSDAGSFMSLDKLYLQVLKKAFFDFTEKSPKWVNRLKILHTFLSTFERTSTSVVSHLLFTSDYTDVAEKLLSDLHAVLYIEHGQVLAYHKSFSDFLFDEKRSGEFWCDPGTHHRLLTDSCFRVMKGLRFNIANIPSSYIFDRDNHALAGAIKQNISPVLSYSCRNWDHHLSATKSTLSDPLHETLSEFLQLCVLFWIEAMNLLQVRGHCYPMLQVAHEWVIKSEASSNLPLVKNLAEAGSFALYFSGSSVCLSTPHLYISTLATWPRKLNPSLGWKSHFPRIPKFVNALIGGTLLSTFNAGSEVNAVAFSGDGSHIVSGSKDKSVQVWDGSTGDQKHVLNGHTHVVKSVAFSSDGSCIVSGSHDKSVQVWDALTGDQKHVLNGHTRVVNSVAFSSDGSCIVSGSNDKSVQVWDVLTGDQKHVLNGHTHSVNSVAFSGDGSHIVSGSDDKSVRVWDASTGDQKHVLSGHTNQVNSVAFSSDGRHIVSGSYDKSVRVWDASTGDQKHVLNGHTNSVNSVAFSIAFSSDGSHIVSGSYDNSVRVWDASTDDQKHVLNGHTSSVNSVAFSNDGSHIVSGSYDDSVRVWDASTVAFSSDGSCIVSGSYDKSIQVWDASTGDQKHVLNGHTNSVNSVAFSMDGSCIVSGSSDNSVWVWDALTGDQKHVLNGHTNSVNSVAFSSDSSCIISGSYDHSIRVWDASAGDGSHIVSGSSDKSVRVWDVSTGDQKHVLSGHTNWVNSVAFSNDGSRIISGSDDNSVRVWDASTATLTDGSQHTGWLLSPHGEGYLMFVPPAERLPDDANILTIPHSSIAHVDFINSSVGLEWTSCYSP
ncbi:hypothetical protein GALMADRAFT_1363458 [Galerina marginata CBS 339.88]|uniref:Bulb-type lectin domain-containing protein n=1 Tax=Galerina marginata (strain CBS 339.88) TaxID=685588 RepID=A0A067TJZ1_GALM3|nr:hypothetical protein GALMADRAFT_1363458 [Galerina marginata CBS 339.88]